MSWSTWPAAPRCSPVAGSWAPVTSTWVCTALPHLSFETRPERSRSKTRPLPIHVTQRKEPVPGAWRVTETLGEGTHQQRGASRGPPSRMREKLLQVDKKKSRPDRDGRREGTGKLRREKTKEATIWKRCSPVVGSRETPLKDPCTHMRLAKSIRGVTGAPVTLWDVEPLSQIRRPVPRRLLLVCSPRDTPTSQQGILRAKAPMQCHQASRTPRLTVP